MKVLKVTNKNFGDEVLKSTIPVLVDFNAEWCGPCKMLKPILDEIASETKEFKIVSINIDDNEDLAEEYGIYSIPCLIVFKNGKETNRSVGLKPKDSILTMMEDI